MVCVQTHDKDFVRHMSVIHWRVPSVHATPARHHVRWFDRCGLRIRSRNVTMRYSNSRANGCRLQVRPSADICAYRRPSRKPRSATVRRSVGQIRSKACRMAAPDMINACRSCPMRGSARRPCGPQFKILVDDLIDLIGSHSEAIHLRFGRTWQVQGDSRPLWSPSRMCRRSGNPRASVPPHMAKIPRGILQSNSSSRQIELHRRQRRQTGREASKHPAGTDIQSTT